MRSKRDIVTSLIFGLIFLASLSVMLYPTVSNWWNSNMASHNVAVYQEEVTRIDTAAYEQMLEEARAYNDELSKLYAPFTDFEQIPGYEDVLNLSGTGIMGYISIPNINVELPIYHGTSEGVLQVASGHIQGSSLPIGGPGTHAVISGHRGLPNAKLFTDLDQIVEGDIFTINILNEVLTYEVDKIRIVLPDETDKLAAIPGEDTVTLMTCTPYGVNTHRLLIRGHRIRNLDEKRIKVSGDALQVDSMTVIPAVFAPLLGLLLLWWGITGKRRKQIRIDKYMIQDLPRERGDGHGQTA